MKRILPLVVLSVLLVCAVSGAWAEAVKLRYKFTPGEIDKYKATVTMKMNMPGMPEGAGATNMNMKMILHQKTLGILPDGSAKVLITYKDFDVSGPGAAAGLGDMFVGKSITMTMDSEGRVLEIDAGQLSSTMGNYGPAMDMNSMMNSMSLYAAFPKEAIDVGQSWTQMVPLGIMGGDMTVTSNLVNSSEELWSQQACKIKQSFDAKMDLQETVQNMYGSTEGTNPQIQEAMSKIRGEMNMTGEGVSYFCPAMGKLLKSNASMAMTTVMKMPPEAVVQGAPAEMKINMNMEFTMSRFK